LLKPWISLSVTEVSQVTVPTLLHCRVWYCTEFQPCTECVHTKRLTISVWSYLFYQMVLCVLYEEEFVQRNCQKIKVPSFKWKLKIKHFVVQVLQHLIMLPIQAWRRIW
jgi:hypothetical protein